MTKKDHRTLDVVGTSGGKATTEVIQPRADSLSVPDSARQFTKPEPVQCSKCGSHAGWDGPTYRSFDVAGTLGKVKEHLEYACKTCGYVRTKPTFERMVADLENTAVFPDELKNR